MKSSKLSDMKKLLKSALVDYYSSGKSEEKKHALMVAIYDYVNDVDWQKLKNFDEVIFENAKQSIIDYAFKALDRDIEIGDISYFNTIIFNKYNSSYKTTLKIDGKEQVENYKNSNIEPRLPIKSISKQNLDANRSKKLQPQYLGDEEIGVLKFLAEQASWKPRQQSVFELRFLEGQEYDEISINLGIPSGTVRSDVSIVKGKLKEVASGYGETAIIEDREFLLSDLIESLYLFEGKSGYIGRG